MNIENQIEFNKIKEIWKNLTVTDFAKEKIDNLSFYLSESELRKELKDTTDSRKMIEVVGNPPLVNVEIIKEILISAEKGECLTPYQLERIGSVLIAIRRLKDYLIRGKMQQNSIAYYEENLDSLDDLREEILKQIRNEQVDDYASKELLQLRNQINKCNEQMKQKADHIIRSNKEYMADSYYTSRNGRICVPVKKEYKFRISGSVIDKSTTGNTLFIEPTSVAKYYEELQLLRINEENEIYRILYTLTAMVATNIEVMYENVKMIEKLDFIFSKGKLSVDLDAVHPSINTDRRIILKSARHPLMDKNENVPLQFEIGSSYKGIVITGPNTGGKTVAIKTVMLNCMMAGCGLHVTCKEADICMNSAYLCDIGDGQNISENLSTFSAHIKNVLNVLSKVNRESFVIMDELGSGTDPTEGMGIAIAILEELRKSDCLFLVTTHYPEIKEYASITPDIINARMAFDRDTLRPTYQMEIGEAGESCAFYIADRLGMPKEMLNTAIRYSYGENAINNYNFENQNIKKISGRKVNKTNNKTTTNKLRLKYSIGDSVMVYPDKKIGIVCEPINEKGVLRVQLTNKKIWINHKRVKLHVKATQLYPEDYDFSIVFESVENRKKQHDMSRKYINEVIEYDD